MSDVVADAKESRHGTAEASPYRPIAYAAPAAVMRLDSTPAHVGSDTCPVACTLPSGVA